MKCSDVRELINAYIDSELGELEMRRVAQHIEKCDSCRAEVEQFQKTSDLIAEYGRETAPVSLLNDLRMKMEKEKPVVSNVRPFRKKGWWALAASFVLVILGGAYINVFNIDQSNLAPAGQVMANAPVFEKAEKRTRAVAPVTGEMLAVEADSGLLLSDMAADGSAAGDAALNERIAEEPSPTPAQPAMRMAAAPTVSSHAIAHNEDASAGSVSPTEIERVLSIEPRTIRPEETAIAEEPAPAVVAVAADELEEVMPEHEVILARVREAFDDMEKELEMERILGSGTGSELPREPVGSTTSSHAGGIVLASARAPESRSAGRVYTVGAGSSSPRVTAGNFNFIEEAPYEYMSPVVSSRNMRRVLRAEDVYSVENADAAAADCERIIEATLTATGDSNTKYIRDGRRVILRGRFDVVDPIRRKLIVNFTGRENIAESSMNGVAPAPGSSSQQIPPNLISVLQINFTH